MIKRQGAARMDPEACLDRLLDAATSGDADELRGAADDLAAWLQDGGFPPRDPREGR
jgi:hypothetical protein